MAEVGTGGDRLFIVQQSPVGGDNGGEAGGQRQRIAARVLWLVVGAQADGAGRHAQRVHHVELLGSGGTQQVERGSRKRPERR